MHSRCLPLLVGIIYLDISFEVAPSECDSSRRYRDLARACVRTDTTLVMTHYSCQISERQSLCIEEIQATLQQRSCLTNLRRVHWLPALHVAEPIK